MDETFALLIALAAVIGIFVVIPLVVFLIVRKYSPTGTANAWQ